MNTSRSHAIVVGASMGGLCAAAALAPHYERVTVLDRDTLPAEPAHRRGVPQSKHAHGLQPGGLRALNELLPGLEDELVAGGAPRGDMGVDCTWTIGGIRYAAGPSGVNGLGLSRPYLENCVRRRVAALPNVTIRDGVEVRRLLADDPATVTGVEIAPADGGPAERMTSDLVVDATGKVTKLPEWLAALGYAPPVEERVRCRMAYLTRRWRLDAAADTGRVLSVIAPAETPHFGVMIAQEDGTHIVTVGGLLDSGPDKTDEAYLDHLERLPDPIIADALAGATPVTELQPSHFPASVRRRYDKLREFPSGLVAIADAIASFNPMYGQGMSVAALEAVELRAMLARGPLDVRKFFAAAHRIEDVAWKISTGGDLRFDGVEGKRTPDMKLMNRYLDRLGRAAHSDPTLTVQFLAVAGFVERPESLFKPSVISRVLRRGGARVSTGPLSARRDAKAPAGV
jgi:2-polyprenyl-6-methoxyphenol hydroxylase-like FAD-dependent oxidoreductase